MKRQGGNPDGHTPLKYLCTGSNISGIAIVTDLKEELLQTLIVVQNYVPIGSRANIADGDWHHVAVTRDSSGYFKIWVDGQLDATVTNTASDGMATSTTWAIGRHGSGTAKCLFKR